MGSTVLIADDADFMRVMLKDILGEMGLSVVGEAGDGQQAVRLHRELRPDIVALDLTMPRLDGIGALKEILKENPQTIVVVITALGQKQKVLQAIQAGASDFLVKPFDPDRVRETMRRFVATAVA